MKGKGKLLKIYIGESDKYNGETLYHAVLKEIKSEGLAGATIVRGIEGFGATSKIIHTTRLECLAVDLPIVIEVVDYQEKIDILAGVLKKMISSGVMITMQDVEIVRYTQALKN